jgi:hydrocephalus-inducing protein
LTIDLRNVSRIPAVWRLKRTKELGPVVTFTEQEGKLNPRASFVIRVTFTSPKPVIVKKSAQIEIVDKEQQRIFATIPVNITAEAFDVAIDFQYPKGFDHLQFGSLKVLQPRAIACQLKNKGKFPVKFAITYDSQAAQQLITVNPLEGTVQTGEKPVNLNFTFKASKVVIYTNAKGLTLSISDPITNTSTGKITLPFSCETVYSQFSISPTRRLQFGAVCANTATQKQLTIKNEGKFPFDFEITGRVDDSPAVAAATEKKKQAPPAKPRGKKGLSQMTIGSYNISPANGTLAPDASANLDIDFMSATAGNFQTSLFFKVTDSDPSAGDHNAVVVVTASCIFPGLKVTDSEKLFPGTSLCLRYDLSRSNRTAFLDDEQVLHFRPTILQRREFVDLAIINPFPVPCVADLSVKPKTKQGNANFPFDVSEKVVTLDPETSKIVALGCLPVTPDNFTGLFEAVVRGGSGDSRALRFGVEGVGTLPTISVETSFDRTKGNTFHLNLGRTLIGFTKEKAIRLLNEGVIDAVIAVTIKPNPDFIVPPPERLKGIIVPAGQSYNLPVVFKPDKLRRSVLETMVTVADNPKLTLSINIAAEGSSEDVVFEGLQSDEGEIVFKDCIVGRQQQVIFTMRNMGANDVRFLWSTQPNLTFAPKIGHLHVNKSKTIIASFFADHPVKLASAKVTCRIDKVEFNEINPPDWDDTMKIMKFMSRKSLNPNRTTPMPSAHRGKKKEKEKASASPAPVEAETQIDELVRVTEIKEEPTFTVLQGKGKEIPLKVTTVADVIKYHLDIDEIAFSPTMMYERRVSECKVTNTSQIRFEYHWRVAKFVSLRSAYAKNHPPPFAIEPGSGIIEPGQATVFRVIFAPLEVDDFVGTMQCDIPYLIQMEPPTIAVTGLSRRPLCHFNVVLADYLSAGRRHPDFTSKLPDDVKVIEMFSKGIGQKSMKKFELINPTATPYEMAWQYTGQDSTTPIFCETASGLISSGRRCPIIFGFLPVSVKTIESLWEFQIPEQGVRVSFLFVGKIIS